MRYIYYIIGILILLTLGLAVRLNGLRVEVSEPALIINDRIISKSELGEFAKVGSYHSQGQGFLDTVITRELLIQEAIRQGIHKEEAFRASVEAYYEQSLVKAVVDRKLQSVSPEVTDEMVGRYQEMCLKGVTYTKFVYGSEDDRQTGNAISETTHTYRFEDFSDTMKYTLFRLASGEGVLSDATEEGIVVFQLDTISADQDAGSVPDDGQVRTFLEEQARNAMLEKWLRDIRKSADIREFSQSGK
jgi:hypothetical protein